MFSRCRRRSLTLLAVPSRFAGRIPAKELIEINPFHQSLGIDVRVIEQVGSIERIVLFAGDNGQPGITIPAQESFAYVDPVVLETARVGLIGGIDEIVGREADPGKEATIKFHLGIQTQTKAPPVALRHMILTVGTRRYGRSRII